MAVCSTCKQDMLTKVSCLPAFVTVRQPKRRKLVVPRNNGSDGEYCHDCAAPAGAYHHSGCDMEKCPQCGGQLLGMDCGCYR